MCIEWCGNGAQKNSRTRRARVVCATQLGRRPPMTSPSKTPTITPVEQRLVKYLDGKPVLTELRAAEILGGFEKEHRLFAFGVKGVSVWQILRFAVGIDL